jgi:ABC-type Fe3+-siderophore transport system permease subunit
MKLIRVLAASLALVGTILYCTLAREDAYTRLLTVIGGVSLGLAALRFDERGKTRLPPWFQFLLGTFAILAAVLAAKWTAFHPPDLSRWSVVSMINLIYRDGFLWAWSYLTGKEMSHS